MSDPRKRIHTLLTDSAVAGLSAHEREELEVLLAGGAIDPSYEQAAAAIELALLDHTESMPAWLEAGIVEQASRYYGYTELRPREPTLGGSGGGEVMLGSGERTGEHDLLESSMSAGRIDQLLEADGDDEDLPDPDRDAILRATHDGILRATQDEEDDDDDDDFDLDGDDDDDDLDGDDDELERPVALEPPSPAKPKRAGKPARQGRREPEPEPAADSLASPIVPMPPGRVVRWATYVSAIAALVMLGIALWLFSTRDRGPTTEDVQASVEAAADKLEWSFTAKPDPSVATDAGGKLVWSSDLQAGVMTLHGLEANDPTTAQYQLWIVDRGRDGPPVDGGVFDVRVGEDGATEVQISIDAKLLVSDPAAFVITVERPGGVVVSSQARVAMVAAP